MRVDLIDHMGSDLDVVNAARVSFDKESDWRYRCGADCSDHGHSVNGECQFCEPHGLEQHDAKLITYLAKHKHWSPFSHCFVKFRIKAPIFVARQLQKHVVGLAWNEVSRRYVDSEPEFYQPNIWRKKADNVKQGSSNETVKLSIEWLKSMVYAERVYKDMIELGVCPEQARMILPQAMYTEWIWSGSLYAFARVCKQRLDSHAQAETRYIAAQIAEHMKTLFPVSWEALMENS